MNQINFTSGLRIPERAILPERELSPTEQYLMAFEKLQHRAGPLAAAATIDFVSGRIDADEFSNTIEIAPDFGAFQEKGMELLRLLSVVSEDARGLLVNIEKLKTLPSIVFSPGEKKDSASIRRHFDNESESKQAQTLLRQLHKDFPQYCGDSGRNFLFNVFRGKKVFDQSEIDARKDGSSGGSTPKDLFYDPPLDTERAFSVEQIRSADFHLGLWEIGGGYDVNEAYSEFHPDIGYEEMALAVSIYHPRYGQGARTTDNVLLVSARNDVGENMRIPVSQDWLVKHCGIRNISFTGDLGRMQFGSPYTVLETGGFSELVSRGLLRKEDFKKMIPRGEQVSGSYFKRITHDKGMVTLENGVRYTLGAEFAQTPHAVVKVTEDMYGIVSIDERLSPLKLVAVLDVVDPTTGVDFAKEQKTTKGATYYTVGKRDLEQHSVLRMFDSEHIETAITQTDSEDLAVFQKKRERISKFCELLPMRKEVFEVAQVRLEQLPMEEQVAFLSLYQAQHTDEEKQMLLHIVQQFGKDGVYASIAAHDSGTSISEVYQLATAKNNRETGKVVVEHGHAREYIQILRQAFDGASSETAHMTQVFSALEKKMSTFLLYSLHKLGQNDDMLYEDIVEGIRQQRPGMVVRNAAEAIAASAVIELTNVFGDVQARRLLDTVRIAGQHAQAKRMLDQMYAYMTPVKSDEKAIHDLESFYNSTHFETYTLNEAVNAKELAWLKEVLPKKGSTLDLGCGTGRLLLPLFDQKYDVIGLDASARHVQYVTEQDQRVGVKKGDWKQTGFRDASFDSLYSLGRNILHETQLTGQYALFQEAARLLKPGGQFIIDIPNREVGGYRALTDGYADVMRQRGIETFRYGTIYDSPDGVHFATRYAYSQEDIALLAEASGFRIKTMRREVLPTAQGDEVLYFVLEKMDGSTIAE